VKKAKAELFNTENLALRVELDRTGLLQETAKACQLTKKAAKALPEAENQWTSILEHAL
jgi:hypothetical protein